MVQQARVIVTFRNTKNIEQTTFQFHDFQKKKTAEKKTAENDLVSKSFTEVVTSPSMSQV